MIQRFLKNWIERHQTGFNRVLHAVGIPLTVIGLMLLFWGKFALATLLFVGGYILQIIGHAREKTEVGELIWIKKLFRK